MSIMVMMKIIIMSIMMMMMIIMREIKPQHYPVPLSLFLTLAKMSTEHLWAMHKIILAGIRCSQTFAPDST